MKADLSDQIFNEAVGAELYARDKVLSLTEDSNSDDIYDVCREFEFAHEFVNWSIHEGGKALDSESHPIVSVLADVEIEDRDYTNFLDNGQPNDFFTWDEAMEESRHFEDGWRLPTRREWTLICEEFGQTMENGLLSPRDFANTLHMSYSRSLAGAEYWSATADDKDTAFVLRIDDLGVRSYSSIEKTAMLRIRRVRDIDLEA